MNLFIKQIVCGNDVIIMRDNLVNQKRDCFKIWKKFCKIYLKVNIKTVIKIKNIFED